LFRKKRK